MKKRAHENQDAEGDAETTSRDLPKFSALAIGSEGDAGKKGIISPWSHIPAREESESLRQINHMRCRHKASEGHTASPNPGTERGACVGAAMGSDFEEIRSKRAGTAVGSDFEEFCVERADAVVVFNFEDHRSERTVSAPVSDFDEPRCDRARTVTGSDFPSPSTPSLTESSSSCSPDDKSGHYKYTDWYGVSRDGLEESGESDTFVTKEEAAAAIQSIEGNENLDKNDDGKDLNAGELNASESDDDDNGTSSVEHF